MAEATRFFFSCLLMYDLVADAQKSSGGTGACDALAAAGDHGYSMIQRAVLRHSAYANFSDAEVAEDLNGIASLRGECAHWCERHTATWTSKCSWKSSKCSTCLQCLGDGARTSTTTTTTTTTTTATTTTTTPTTSTTTSAKPTTTTTTIQATNAAQAEWPEEYVEKYDLHNKAATLRVMPGAEESTWQPSKCPHWKSELGEHEVFQVTGQGAMALAKRRYLLTGSADLGTRSLVIPSGAVLVLGPFAKLSVGELVVSGSLVAGSESCPMGQFGGRWADVTITLTGPKLDAPGEQHKHGRKGLVVTDGGALSIYGWRFKPTWTRLARTAQVGAQELRLSQAVDWRPGDKVVVATTVWMDDKDNHQNEERLIKAVSADGKTITFEQSFGFTHYGGPEYQAEVGLLSRTVTVQGDAQSDAESFGGHVMCTKGSKCQVQGVLGLRLGQLNEMGKYPFHFHRMGEVSPTDAFFRDCAVYKSFFRAFTIHGTNNSRVQRNVAFDIKGHAVYLEDGVEENNDIEYNLVLFVHPISPLADYSPSNVQSQQGVRDVVSHEKLLVAPDIAASGFYCTNANNRWVGNAASGGFSGFIFPAVPHALGASWEENQGYEPLSRPMKEFDSNTAHSSGRLWTANGACVYVGGAIVNDPLGSSTYVYTYGRTLGDKYKHSQLGDKAMDVRPKIQYKITNMKTAVCKLGYLFWGGDISAPTPYSLQERYESADVFKAAHLMGDASINGAIMTGHTNNRVLGDWSGASLPQYANLFEQYDLGMLTVMVNAHCRGLSGEGDVCFKDVTRSATTNSILAVSATFDQDIPKELWFRHAKKDLSGSHSGKEQFHCNVRNNLWGSEFSPCKQSCETSCPGTSYSSQLVAMEVPDGSLFVLGDQFKDGAILGGHDQASETSGTNNWWLIDDKTCVADFFKEPWSRGFWVCPSLGERRAVNIMLLDAAKFEHLTGDDFMGWRAGQQWHHVPIAEASQWAISGTLYHFGHTDRRLEIDKGLPTVQGPCCDVGWYLQWANKPTRKLVIQPYIMASEGGLVLSASYGDGASLTLKRCSYIWTGGQIGKSCISILESSSREELVCKTEVSWYVQSTSSSKRAFVKVVSPQDSAGDLIGGVHVLKPLNNPKIMYWLELSSSIDDQVFRDVPDELPSASHIDCLQFSTTTTTTTTTATTCTLTANWKFHCTGECGCANSDYTCYQRGPGETQCRKTGNCPAEYDCSVVR